MSAEPQARKVLVEASPQFQSGDARAAHRSGRATANFEQEKDLATRARGEALAHSIKLWEPGREHNLHLGRRWEDVRKGMNPLTSN